MAEVEQIRVEVHRVAAEVRCPPEIRAGRKNELSEEVLPLTAQEKVTAIENYMVDLAEARGALEHGKLILKEALNELLVKARDVPWQNMLQGVKKPTQAQIAEAKRRSAPDLCSSIDSAKHLLDLLRDQLDRLDKEHESMSRIYTVITGG